MKHVAEAAAQILDLHRPGWRSAQHAAQWEATLRQYAFPHLRERPVSEITPTDVMAVLRPIWHEKPETARRVRQCIGTVMKWAVAQGYRGDNPAGEALAQALPRNSTIQQHMAALPHGEVAGAIKAVRASEASKAVKLAFEFLVLTATRSGEVRRATWEELDLEARAWTIPGERMKAKRPHRVPLSQRALAILNDARTLAGGDGLVFPSSSGRVLSDNTLSGLLRKLGILAVPHGFRSSFRDWAQERTHAPRAVQEAALGHIVRDKVEAAYARSDLFEHRRELMEQWAGYLGAEGGTVLGMVRHE